MDKMIRKAIIRYLKKHYPNEMKGIVKKADGILPELKSKAPNLGGKENTLADNIDMFLVFLSFYEASEHRIDGDAIDEIIDDLYNRMKFLGIFMNINNKAIRSVMTKYLYKSYHRYADKVAEKQVHGEWLDTWGMIVNPNNTSEGIAFTLVGCPLAEYAKRYGYIDLMPHICALDHAYAKIMHAKLIRTHTVATGADSCDYWYVPDKSEVARTYTGNII